MTDVVLCPNCGGAKNVSKPPYIAGDVNSWVGSGNPTYPCPTCDGRGWIRVDCASQDDFDNVKFVALSSMETAENLMDECTKRADRIKELETELEYMCAGERAADKEIDRLKSDGERDKSLMNATIYRVGNHISGLEAEVNDLVVENDVLEFEVKRLSTKIFDIEGREDLVTTELERRACVAEGRLRVVKELRDELLEDWEAKRGAVTRLESEVRNLRTLVDIKDMRISDFMTMRDVARKARNKREDELLGIVDDLTTKNKQLEAYHDRVRDTHQAREVEFSETCERYEIDLELLDEMLKIVNPLIKSGAYAKPSAESRLLALRMYGLCQTVVQFRRKHGIVG